MKLLSLVLVSPAAAIISDVTESQRADAEHLFAVTKTLVLSAFPNNGHNQTLDGPELDEMLQILNLDELKPKLNDTLKKSDVVPFVNKVFGCVNKNTYLVGAGARFWQTRLRAKSLWENHVSDPELFWTEISESAPPVGGKSHFLDIHSNVTQKFHHKFGLVSDRRKENIRHAVRLTFLLHAINVAFEKEECHESHQCGFKGNRDYIGFFVKAKLLENRQRFNWKKYSHSAFERMKAGFFFNSIEPHFLVNGRAVRRDKMIMGKYSLPLNIMMAGYHDMVSGNGANYATSVYLANRPEQQKQRHWTEAYEAWNLAFTSQFKQNIMFMAPLLDPSVSCAASDDPDSYMASRVLDLTLFINYLAAWREQEHSENPASFEDWSDKSMTNLWGDENKAMIVDSGKHSKRRMRGKKRGSFLREELDIDASASMPFF